MSRIHDDIFRANVKDYYQLLGLEKPKHSEIDLQTYYWDWQSWSMRVYETISVYLTNIYFPLHKPYLVALPPSISTERLQKFFLIATKTLLKINKISYKSKKVETELKFMQKKLPSDLKLLKHKSNSKAEELILYHDGSTLRNIVGVM